MTQEQLTPDMIAYLREAATARQFLTASIAIRAASTAPTAS
ncbi:MAG: hypothetical protein WDN04_02935 [Rhodospirillales bacterium]